jgi:hypothetical protein
METMSFFQKPSDEPNPPISVKIYGAGGGGNHSPAQLGGSVAAAPALGGSSVISGYNNVTIKPNAYNTVGISDHIVQGQMLTVEHIFTTHELQYMDDKHIKQLLVRQLAEKIYQQQCVEFTKQCHFNTDSIIARARIYVTPDSTIKLLRTYQK